MLSDSDIHCENSFHFTMFKVFYLTSDCFKCVYYQIFVFFHCCYTVAHLNGSFFVITLRKSYIMTLIYNGHTGQNVQSLVVQSIDMRGG